VNEEVTNNVMLHMT